MSGVGASWPAANAAAEKTDAEALTEIREVDRPGQITDCFASPALTGGVLEFLGDLNLHEFMGDVGMHSYPSISDPMATSCRPATTVSARNGVAIGYRPHASGPSCL